MFFKICSVLSFVCLQVQFIAARKHHLEVQSDSRGYIPITTFGFYEKGYLQVDVTNLSLRPSQPKSRPVGFSLEKILNPNTDQQPNDCKLDMTRNNDSVAEEILFIFDFSTNRVHLTCSQSLRDILIYNNTEEISFQEPGRKEMSDQALFSVHPKEITKTKENSNKPNSLPETNISEKTMQKIRYGVKCHATELSMMKNDKELYNFSFAVLISNKEQEGLYSLSYHNCYNYDVKFQSSVGMTLKIEAKNLNNYLSAGRIPLPALYFMMSILFFLSACFWYFLLRKSKNPVFKLHYLMGLLVVIKSLSLFFHAVNYHFIQVKGEHMEAWAVMFYIMHLLKGALLFTVLALIGSGWAFIKHILSSKEKKIFIVVIPLQIIANVATIIIEETEESNPDRTTWMQVLFLIDFLCCVAILLPVVWSIRHLQEASQTDGKAAISLSKLKLFRHFYIMIVCYIYFTRIIVYLLQITVTFQYEWLDDMFREMTTFVFFFMTGYKFRPATNNPYFSVQLDDEDMDTCLTTTGLTENISKVNQKQAKRKPHRVAPEIFNEDDDDEEEIDLLLPDLRETRQ